MEKSKQSKRKSSRSDAVYTALPGRKRPSVTLSEVAPDGVELWLVQLPRGLAEAELPDTATCTLAESTAALRGGAAVQAAGSEFGLRDAGTAEARQYINAFADGTDGPRRLGKPFARSVDVVQLHALPPKSALADAPAVNPQGSVRGQPEDMRQTSGGSWACGAAAAPPAAAAAKKKKKGGAANKSKKSRKQ